MFLLTKSLLYYIILNVLGVLHENSKRNGHTMKKLLLITILLLGVFLAACGSDGDDVSNDANISLDDTIKSITEKYNMTKGFIFTSSSTERGEYLDDDLILAYYGDATDIPDFSKISEYCVYVDESDADVIIDVGIFKIADPSYADTFTKYLRARIDGKIEDAEEYSTIDVETLESGVIAKSGSYVYYVVSYDVDDIVSDIKAALK